MSSLENLMRIRRRLKEWAITFLLKIWDRRRGNASLVMLVIGLPKRKPFPKEPTAHIHSARSDNFWQYFKFSESMFFVSFLSRYFFVSFPRCVVWIQIGVYISLMEGGGSLLKGLASMIANPPSSSLKLFDSENKNRFSSSDDKTLSLKLETPTTLSFVGSVGKFRLLYYSFGNAVWEHIRKYVGFVQVRIEWVSCQKTIWIVDAWQVHLAPYWARFLHQTTLHIVAFHKIIFAHFNKGVCCMGRWYASS